MHYLPSVTIPRVPSAPIKSLVVSKPADDFRALRLVFITSPLGRTTVLLSYENLSAFQSALQTHDIQEPFGLRSTVADRICFWSHEH